MAPQFAKILGKNKAAISCVLALTVSIFATKYAWNEKAEWLNQITLEVQMSSAPAMGRSVPTHGALWIRPTSGVDQMIPSKDWAAGGFAKPYSRLRFDLGIAGYQEILFSPDRTLKEIEVVRLCLISHESGVATELPLDRVQSRHNLETTSRRPDSVTFRQIGEEAPPAISLRIGDLVEQMPRSGKPSLSEMALIALIILVGAYKVAFSLVGRLATSEPRVESEPFRPPLLRIGIVASLALCAAAAAPDNSYPDEYLHVEAARYYIQHWLPPSLGSEWVAPSVSHYGYTYLAESDLGYLFAGKFAFWARSLLPDVFSTLRLFNVALLGILLVWAARAFRGAPIWIFFVTPQLWYVFSGYNTEGWAMFVALLVTGQVAAQHSSLQHYLAAPKFRNAIGSLLVPLLLVCLLALTKKNFFALVFLFFSFWLTWHLLTQRRGAPFLTSLTKILPLLLIPLILRFGVQSYQSAVNDHDLPGAIQQTAERHAYPAFKPSVATQGDVIFGGLRMKERGVTVPDLLFRERWLAMTGASFVGVYGWMTFYSPTTVYLLLGIGWVTLIAGVFVMTVTKPPKLQRVFHAIAWGHFPLLLALSIYHSWVYDFQAQGRYLFPFLPILFYLLNAVNPATSRILRTTVWAVFVVSVYGFVFAGLRPLTH